MSDRVLPHNLDAETSVLGCLLVEPQRLVDVGDRLSPADFYRDAHARIFDAIRAMADRRLGIDLVTLKEELSRRGDLEAVGGPVYLASLLDGVPRGVNLPYHADIVREKARRRQLIATCHKAQSAAYDVDQPIEALLETTEADVLGLGQDTMGAGFVGPDAWVGETYAHLERVASEPRHVTGVATGFATLDRMTRGLQPGDLIILAARPSMGKTALMLQAAIEASAQATAGVFSVEMSRRALGIRAFSLVGRINGMRLMTGKLRDEDYGRLTNAMGHLDRLKLAIDDTATLTLQQLRMKARRLKAQHGLGLVCVDYLQLLDPSSGKTRAENRNLELAGMTRALKQLAKELDVPVVVLSQLSRDLERRDDKRPRLSDLRDSGAIEQDADVVLLLHRPEVYQGDTPKPEDIGRAELIVAKQRNGPTGVVELRFTKEYTRFDDWMERAA